MCLGVPATVSLEALEVVREFGKIYAKQDTQTIKQTLKEWEYAKDGELKDTFRTEGNTDGRYLCSHRYGGGQH